jgi:hypothetical protein
VGSGALEEHGSEHLQSPVCRFGSGSGAWRFDSWQGARLRSWEHGSGGRERGSGMVSLGA